MTHEELLRLIETSIRQRWTAEELATAILEKLPKADWGVVVTTFHDFEDNYLPRIKDFIKNKKVLIQITEVK